MQFFILDTIHECLSAKLRDSGHACIDASTLKDNECLQLLPSAEGVILRGRFRFDQQLIDECPSLKIIGRVGAGLEHIDVAYAKSKGITVLSSPEGNRQAVAEHALAMILAMFNRIRESSDEIRQGIWSRKRNEGIEISGKNVGIIGFGNTGSAFAKVLSGFDVEIRAYDKYIRKHNHQSDLRELLRQSDVISLHLPYTPETHFLVNDAFFESCERPFYLINTSRGKIVDTAAVLRALEAGKLLGACLDVLEYENENLSMPDFTTLPETAQQIVNHPKVIVTPHTAGLTVESYEKLSLVLAEKIIHHLG